MTHKNLTIKERILLYLDDNNIQKSLFFKELGIAHSNFTGQGLKSSLSSDKVVKILSMFPNVSLEWLMLGEGEMNKPSKNIETKSLTELKTKEAIIPEQSIPFYNVIASAGILSQIFDQHQQAEDSIFIPNMPRCDGAMQISGDSMSPILQSGDIIAFKRVHSFDYIMWRQIYIVDFSIEGDDYLAIKRLKKSEKGEDYVQLVSENPEHDPIDIPRSAIRHLAIVKFSIRSQNTI